MCNTWHDDYLVLVEASRVGVMSSETKMTEERVQTLMAETIMTGTDDSVGVISHCIQVYYIQ